MSPSRPSSPQEATSGQMAGGPSLTGRPSLLAMAMQFLKIGAIGFGGGMAVIALVERECVRRRRWIGTEEFLHGVGLGQILGPFAVNASIFIGYRLHGIIGGLVAATAFMFPSLVLVISLSWLYFSYHRIPSLQGGLAGISPVVIALIVTAALTMGTKAVRSWPAAVLMILACAASIFHVNPILIIAAAGAAGLLLKHDSSAAPSAKPVVSAVAISTDLLPQQAPAAAASAGTLAAATTVPSAVGLSGLMLTFLKVGFVFFGGGFVLIPVLYHRLVTDLGWLTQREFTDGVAISQLTPGPIAVLATFAGYRVGGVIGALGATVALFAPAVVLMLIISHFYQRLSRISVMKRVLAGIVPAVVGMILSAAIALAPGSLTLRHPLGIVIGILAFGALWRLKWHPAAVLAIGAASGTLFPYWFV